MKKGSRKIMVALTGLMLTFGAFGQDEMMESEEAGSSDGYNRAMFDLDFGLNKAMAKYSPGYGDPILGVGHIGLGASYWINPKFGVKAYLGNEVFSNRSGATNEFKTNYTRISFQGLINISRICNFEDWNLNDWVLHSWGIRFLFDVKRKKCGRE